MVELGVLELAPRLRVDGSVVVFVFDVSDADSLVEKTPPGCFGVALDIRVVCDLMETVLAIVYLYSVRRHLGKRMKLLYWYWMNIS